MGIVQKHNGDLRVESAKPSPVPFPISFVVKKGGKE
jgi:hypothetical protein